MPRYGAGNMGLGPVVDATAMTNPNNKNGHDVVPDLGENSVISHPVRPKAAEWTGQGLAVVSRVA